jgi:dTDP-3-amino-3,4,6-trideoxy-alpha-D-glucose transaminase
MLPIPMPISAAARVRTEPKVPFVDLSRQHTPLAGELRAAFDRVLGASSFILGEEVAGFEAEFADYCGVNHCVGVNSGTAALSLTMTATGVGRGDEVIVPAHTFIASAIGVAQAGATPVFCDVKEDTGLFDADSAAALITPRTAALLPVHLYGQTCEMEAINSLARRKGLLVFEDAAQAHGAMYCGARAGSLGTAAAFSFYPSKNLGALGDGGAICTNDSVIAERARRLRNLGQRRKGDHVHLGSNERLDGLQAALLRVKLRGLDEGNAARRAHAAAYRTGLLPPLRGLHELPHTPCTYHLFPMRTPHRRAAIAFMAERGVQTGLHYAPAAHEHPVWRDLLEPPRVDLSEAEAWAREEVSLPMFPELEPEEVEQVIDACQEWAQRAAEVSTNTTFNGGVLWTRA